MKSSDLNEVVELLDRLKADKDFMGYLREGNHEIIHISHGGYFAKVSRVTLHNIIADDYNYCKDRLEHLGVEIAEEKQ